MPTLAADQDRQPHTPTDLRDRLATAMRVSDKTATAGTHGDQGPLTVGSHLVTNDLLFNFVSA
jgi:hypothetical protein